jgi:sugar phosphate isomerase/epimerase
LIGGRAEEFAWIIGRVDAGICIDTGHIALGRQWRQFMGIVGSRLIHVHASDNHGRFDDHFAPGEGALDWREIAGDLRALDYRGWIMLELKCPPGGDLATRFKTALARSETVLA